MASRRLLEKNSQTPRDRVRVGEAAVSLAFHLQAPSRDVLFLDAPNSV